MILRPKNWHDFQHYSKRNPPWIKLHRGLLDDFEFQCLPVASRALAPLLWLLASESVEGEIRAEATKISFRLRMSENDFLEALKPLIVHGFIIDASNTLAPCYPDATPETETETETETEQRQKSPRDGKKLQNPRNKKVSLDSILSQEESIVFDPIWQNWPERVKEGKVVRGKRLPAEKAFKVLVESGATLEELSQVGASYREHPLVREGYVQLVSTFFGEEGWCREGIQALRSKKQVVNV